MFASYLDQSARSAEVARAHQKFVRCKIHELPTPAAIVDRHVVSSHCDQMLAACRGLGLDFRAHIKTHKTLECTKLQVGESKSEPANLVVSTLAEIELVLPWLTKLEKEGREVNVLYSMPLPPSSIPVLDKYAEAFRKPGTIAIMVDNPTHLEHLTSFTRPPSVFLKIDTGTHRAGLPAESAEFSSLAQATVVAHQAGKCNFLGIYSHASHSYAGRDAENAMQTLLDEINGCLAAERVVRGQVESNALMQPLVLSVGATPTATSAKNLMEGVHAAELKVAKTLKRTLDTVRGEAHHRLELHAGVYPFLDLQQLSTQAAPSSIQENTSSLSIPDIAFTVLAEVTSVYPHRDPPQALIAAGTLALGREPCPRYSGFGAIHAWDLDPQHLRANKSGWGDPSRSGWVVGKVSQEHGVLMPEAASGWEGSDIVNVEAGEVPFRVGQKVRVLPNHACIAGAGHPWYFVVDGDDEIVDVWGRCNGW